jgi:hypothetical protein
MAFLVNSRSVNLRSGHLHGAIRVHSKHFEKKNFIKNFRPRKLMERKRKRKSPSSNLSSEDNFVKHFTIVNYYCNKITKLQTVLSEIWRARTLFFVQVFYFVLAVNYSFK